MALAKVVATRGIVTGQKVGIADCGKDPRRRLPVGSRLGEKVPGDPIAGQRFRIAPRVGMAVSESTETPNRSVDGVSKLGHCALLMTVTRG